MFLRLVVPVIGAGALLLNSTGVAASAADGMASSATGAGAGNVTAANATGAGAGNVTAGNATGAGAGNVTAGNAIGAGAGNVTAGNATGAGAGNVTAGNATGAGAGDAVASNAAATGTGSAAAAATANNTQPAGAPAREANNLGEVVVTAQRRAESAQNVGIALSVLSGQDLAAKGITSVTGLQNAIPSLQVEPAFGSGEPQYRIRGVGFLDYTSNNASPIGVSVDDVAFALPIQTAGQLYDLDRVEVLRGPQGTLYGRNTTGGQINFITNRPTTDTHAGFTAEYGSHNEVNAEGYVWDRSSRD